MNIKPSFEDFKRLHEEGFNIIPVYTEFLADLKTPVGIFLPYKDNDFCFLLESAYLHQQIGKYSFVGVDFFEVFEGDLKKDCLFVLEGKLKNYKAPKSEVLIRFGLDLPDFYGGAVGFLSYDYYRFLEDIGNFSKDDLKLPISQFLFAKKIFIFDHLNHTLKIVINTKVKNPKEDYQNAKEEIKKTFLELKKTKVNYEISLETLKRVDFESNLSIEEYYRMVEIAKEYIYAGDIIQVVLSCRFQKQLSNQFDFFNIYRALRRINPSPYMFYLKMKDLIILGSSPEMLAKIEGNVAYTRPIAGTRPRGKDPYEDKKLRKELLKDAKEKAEHIMLVDLGRNDLGRVCKIGSVKIKKKDFKVIEDYSHVMHIVSSVSGILEDDKDSFSLLKAVFPAGTVVGAPKIRAAQIIQELEPTARGIYAGCICYFGYNQSFDSCIAIRTIVIKGKTCYIQTGAGIVVDSQKEREYQECKNKAEALMQAICYTL